MRSITIIVILLAIVGICSCGDCASRLSRGVAGTWTARPETLNVPGASASQATCTYTFHRTDGKNGGTVELSALIDVSLPVGSGDGTRSRGTTGVYASTVATATGTWHATADDGIYLLFDPRSVKVEVDPSAVLAHGSRSASATVPAAAGMLRDVVARAVERKVATMHHLNGVSLGSDKRTLSWNANYTDITLRRR